MTTEKQQTDQKAAEAEEKAPPPENFTVVTSDWPEDQRQDAAKEEAEETTEKAAGAEEEAKAKDGADKEDAEGEEGSKGALPEGVAKELARSRRRAREAEDRARTLEERLAELEEERKADEADDEEADSLDPNDFDTYEEYLEAKKEADDKRKSPRQKAKEKAEGDGEMIDGIPVADVKTATQNLYQAVADVDEDFAKQLVAQDNPLGLTVTAPMIVAINDADDPAGVMRHLAENPELSEEIAGMSPKRMERRLIKLEVELARGEAAEARQEQKAAEKDAQAASKKGTDAPDPITPNSGRHQAARTPEQAIARGDFKTYERLMNEADERRRKAGW